MTGKEPIFVGNGNDARLSHDYKLSRRIKATVFMMFNGSHKEITNEDLLDELKHEGVEVHPTYTGKILKELTSDGTLHRERRKIKKYISGQASNTSQYYYWLSKDGKNILASMNDRFEETIVDPNKAFELVPEEMRGRPAFSTSTKLTPEEIALEKQKETAVEETVVTAPEKKEKTPAKTPEGTVAPFAQMSFQDALLRIYEGKRIVSAVSGNIYSMVDKDNLKGITCSSRPGAIISFFPPIEMAGQWRELELPKTCPYCNSAVKLMQNDTSKLFYYMCVNSECTAKGPKARTPEEAVMKFNKRC